MDTPRMGRRDALPPPTPAVRETTRYGRRKKKKKNQLALAIHTSRQKPSIASSAARGAPREAYHPEQQKRSTEDRYKRKEKEGTGNICPPPPALPPSTYASPAPA